MIKRIIASILAAAALIATGCAPRVTVQYDIHRTMPVILDRGDGSRKFEVGLAHGTGSGEHQEYEDIYTADVYRTFGCVQGSNTLLYGSFTPLPRLTITGGIDAPGLCGDLTVRPVCGNPCLYVNAGATYYGQGARDWFEGTPTYLRLGLGGAVWPFLLAADSAGTISATGLSLTGDVTWAEYPLSIEFEQTLYDTSGSRVSSWALNTVQRGKGMIASGGIAYGGRRYRLYLRAQHCFNLHEQGVRIDRATQPAYLVGTTPGAVTALTVGLGLTF